MKPLIALVVSAAAVAAASPWASRHVPAADHGDSPAVRFDGRLDLNDVYAFVSPENSANGVYIMTSSPAAGVVTPAEFASKSLYVFHFDVDGDARDDTTVTCTFGKPASDGTQEVNIKSTGAAKFKASGQTGTEIAIPGGGRFIAGNFDDPFFFDLIAFRNSLMFQNPGTNFFRRLNTMAIVMELPNTTFADSTIGVWCSSSKGRKQIDRNGRPAINTVFISGPTKDAFNRAQPTGDVATFRSQVVAVITSLSNATNANALADILMPDILTIDLSMPTAFPNGRALADDVIDIELGLITAGAVTSDGAANDSTFRSTFPYLGVRNP